MEDLISVIIPIYNVENYLERCIESILNQTYKNTEIILVNDGSTDKSGIICDKYCKMDDRIKVIHKVNGGLSDARNTGTELANGCYVTYIDSDDYVELDYIEYLYKLIKKYKTSISICAHKAIYDNGTILDHTTNEESVISGKEVLERMLYDDGIDLSAWAKLYDIDIVKNVKFPVGRLYEDAATTYKMVDQCDQIACGLISKYNYMIRSTSITGAKFSKRKMDLIISTSEMAGYIGKKYPDLKKAVNRRLIYSYMSTLSQLAKVSDSSNFKNEEKEMIKFIKDNTRELIGDKRVPVRDKIGALSVWPGMKFYKTMWNVYSKFTGRN